jgi:hypothetical protein
VVCPVCGCGYEISDIHAAIERSKAALDELARALA